MKRAKQPEHSTRDPGRKRRWTKWLFWILVLVALYFGHQWLSAQFLELMKMHPALWAAYQAVEEQIRERTLIGLFYAAFFGALFFITLPVEAIFLYYLTLNYYHVQIITVTLLGNLLGISINYFIGWLLGPRVLKFFMRDKYESFRAKLDKAGAFLLIIGNIIPFPIEPLTVVLGAARYGYVRLLIYTVIGKLVKFAILFIGYEFFQSRVLPYVQSLDVPPYLEFLREPFRQL